jgi:hypothetical protein
MPTRHIPLTMAPTGSQPVTFGGLGTEVMPRLRRPRVHNGRTLTSLHGPFKQLGQCSMASLHKFTPVFYILLILLPFSLSINVLGCALVLQLHPYYLSSLLFHSRIVLV